MAGERASGPFVTVSFDAVNNRMFWGTASSTSPSTATDIDARGISVPVFRVVTDNGVPSFRFENDSGDSWLFDITSTRFRVVHDTGSGLTPVLSLGTVKPSVTGAKGGNAALASLIAALVTLELIEDNTTV